MLDTYVSRSLPSCQIKKGTWSISWHDYIIYMATVAVNKSTHFTLSILGVYAHAGPREGGRADSGRATKAGTAEQQHGAHDPCHMTWCYVTKLGQHEVGMATGVESGGR